MNDNTENSLKSILSSINSKLSQLEIMSGKITSLESEVAGLKSQKPSYKDSLTNESLSNAISLSATAQAKTNVANPFHRLKITGSRRGSVSSNTSKRLRDSSNEDGTRKKPKAELLVGSNTNSEFTGVAKPKPRRHIYVGRIPKNVSDKGITDWCSSQNAPLQHIREITNENRLLKVFIVYLMKNTKKLFSIRISGPLV